MLIRQIPDILGFIINDFNNIYYNSLPQNALSYIILFQNKNPPGLCNVTRLLVKKMVNNVIEATILTGKFKGEDVQLQRIEMKPTDMSFKYKRLQFPMQIAFAMS